MNNLLWPIPSLFLILFTAGPACSQLSDNGPIDNPLQPKDRTEQKILNSLEEIRGEESYYNVSVRDGRLLRLLTEATDAQVVVEIGTSTGESAIWFALALIRTGGHLYTHEIDPKRARTARDNFKRTGVDTLITLIEGDAHETVKEHEGRQIDILFLDADKAGYPDYLKKLLPMVRPGGLIIAHNMNYPEPDPQYIKAITQDSKLETAFLLMSEAGLGVTLKKR
ncbi:MAG: class I SAM-dependent methyltransferase [Balneolaceae bacterium]|nr:class I SAM-dependent methyltransferase [Balneolaceae bacterium]